MAFGGRSIVLTLLQMKKTRVQLLLAQHPTVRKWWTGIQFRWSANRNFTIKWRFLWVPECRYWAILYAMAWFNGLHEAHPPIPFFPSASVLIAQVPLSWLLRAPITNHNNLGGLQQYTYSFPSLKSRCQQGCSTSCEGPSTFWMAPGVDVWQQDSVSASIFTWLFSRPLLFLQRHQTLHLGHTLNLQWFLSQDL